MNRFHSAQRPIRIAKAARAVLPLLSLFLIVGCVSARKPPVELAASPLPSMAAPTGWRHRVALLPSAPMSKPDPCDAEAVGTGRAAASAPVQALQAQGLLVAWGPGATRPDPHAGVPAPRGVDALVAAKADDATQQAKGDQPPRPACRVSLRVLDPLTGGLMFTVAAEGEDGDRRQALAGAWDEAARQLQERLAERPPEAAVLALEGSQVRLTAGAEQGLAPGQVLVVRSQGDRVRSRKTGGVVVLPGRVLARLRVERVAAGSMPTLARVVDGSLAGLRPEDLTVPLAAE